MDQDVSKTGDLSPGDVRLDNINSIAQSLAELRRGLEVAQHGVLDEAGAKQDRAAGMPSVNEIMSPPLPR